MRTRRGALGRRRRRLLADLVALREWLLVVIDPLGEPGRTDAIAARVAVEHRCLTHRAVDPLIASHHAPGSARSLRTPYVGRGPSGRW